MRTPCYLALSLLLISFPLTGCGEKIEPGNTAPKKGPAIAVQVEEVNSATYPILYDAVGSVKAQVSATISSKLMGTVIAVDVKEGDRIRKGDTLVLLDERQVIARLNQAEAALEESRKAEAAAVSALKAAEAEAEQALSAYNRGRKMLAGSAITRQDFEQIEAQYKKANAALSQAKSMLEAAGHRVKQVLAEKESVDVSRKDARVLAPFDGKVTAKQVDAGDLASPGSPLLTIEGVGAYRIDLVVPETHIQAIRLEQKVEVRIPAIGDTPMEGTVFVIVPTADQISRSFMVQVVIAQAEGLRSGMFARVSLPVGEKPMIRIPRSALVHHGQLTGVFIIDAERTARFRLIRVGSPAGDRMEVISGIADGTRIVVSPPSQLTNGSPVELVQ
ncbi:MAG: efflux RND transporter periplasmic adaptor subunit [Thermodesulfobacteriota bacterium]